MSAVLSSELIKIRRSAIWLAVLVVPLVSVLIGSGSFYVNREVMTGGPWADLWTQVALFYGYFFYPLLMAVIAAYLWRLEHSGTNWNMIKTLPVSSSSLWFSKLFILYLCALITQSLMILFYFLSGKFLFGFSGSIPSYFWWWLVAGPVCVLAPGSFQLYLSLKIKSFSIPIAIGFICCFIGLGCYANGLWFFPNTLAIIGMNAQHEGLPTLLEMTKAFGGTLFWIILFSALGIRSLNRYEA